MDSLNKYIIVFGDLKNGVHFFNFNLNNDFFENFDTSEIRVADINAIVTIDKKEHLLSLNFDISGIAQIECDRCLEMFDLPIEYNSTMYIKSEDSFSDESDDVIVIPKTKNEINIAQFLYEFSALSLPYRRVHPDDENGESSCDPEMLEKLKELSLNNSNDLKNNMWNDLKNLIN